MKKAIPKILIFFSLIPWLLSLIFTGVDCLLNNMYLEWLWITDWMMILPDTLAYYLVYAAVFMSFGAIAYLVFYKKALFAAILTPIYLLLSFAFPFSRYIVHHFGLRNVLYDIGMLDLFYDDFSTALSLLLYAALAVAAILLTRLFYAAVVHKTPANDTRAVSLRSPISLALGIFFAVFALMATVYFISVGSFTLDNFISLGLEYVIAAGGFFLSMFAARCFKKWDVNS